jgi:hypothetical protein
MALTELAGGGFLFPTFPQLSGRDPRGALGASNPHSLIDAASEYVGSIGPIAIVDPATGLRVSGSHTISAAGGGKLHVYLQTLAYASAGSTFRVGLQDVTDGPPLKPDGTFDVYKDYVQGTDALATGWVAAAMASGSKSLSSGDSIFAGIALTVQSGADSLRLQMQGNGLVGPAMGISFLGGAFNTTIPAYISPIVIEFDDGKLGFFQGAVTLSDNVAYDSGDTPDEYGLIFQVQRSCKIDAILADVSSTTAAVDGNITLYSDPLGTPAALWGPVAFTAERQGSSGAVRLAAFAAAGGEIELSPDTDYAVAVQSTNATNNNLLLYRQSFASAAHRCATATG